MALSISPTSRVPSVAGLPRGVQPRVSLAATCRASRALGLRSTLVFAPAVFQKRISISAAASAVEASPALGPAITLSDAALTHLRKMREGVGKDMLLRVGVRQGGCSGFSYVMDFEEKTNVGEGDSVVEYEGFSMVCDPKSLLFLFGMRLDYSDALIGGGFSFSNPNASSTCGCGKSFAA